MLVSESLFGYYPGTSPERLCLKPYARDTLVSMAAVGALIYFEYVEPLPKQLVRCHDILRKYHYESSLLATFGIEKGTKVCFTKLFVMVNHLVV